MSKYILKLTGSNQIVNIIEWDGSTELSFPSLYELEPFVTSSTDFIQNPTASIDAITNYVGIFDGDFIGNLSGSVKINGQSFNELINATKYGYLKFISGSDIETQGITPSFIIDNFDQPTNIILPLDNQYSDYGYDYSGSLNRILNNNGASNIIKFKNILDTSKEMQFLINNAEITGSNVSLNVSEIYNSFYNDIYFDTTQSNNLSIYNRTDWYVDFDLGDKAQSGKFYGDFFGNVDITSASMDSLIVSGTINLSGSMGVTGPVVVNGDQVLTTRQGCDVVLKLRNVFTDIGIDPVHPPKWSMILGYPFFKGSVNSIYTRFDVHIPQVSWFDKFYITLPVYVTDAISDFDKESWWYTLLRKLLGGNDISHDMHPGREGITLKFDGLLDAMGNPLGQTKEYMYVEFTNDKAIPHKDGGNVEAVSFPVKLVGNRYNEENAGISYNIRDWEELPDTDSVYREQPDISGIQFCLKFDYLETCAECQESTNTNTNTVSTTNNDDTSLAMSWHTNVVNYDQNGTPLSQLQEMEAGTIAISHPSRGSQDQYMGIFSQWPVVNFKSVNNLAIALSDGDTNNLIWSDWQSNNVYNDEDSTIKYNNIYNAINGDMSVLYRLLNQVKIMQGLKPTFYGRYNNNISYTNEQYTSLMTVRCLNESHPGSVETFDITGVQFIGSGIDTNLRWSNVVSAGGFTSLALKARTQYANSIWMWGKNNVYQLGINNTNEQNTPYRVSNDSWISASINISHSMAINEKGEVWVWGNNQYGQLGQGNYTNSTTPVMVSGNMYTYTDFIGEKLHKVSAGNNHSCIIKRDQAESDQEKRLAYFCGNNEYGQLGIAKDTSNIEFTDNITNTRLSRLNIPQFYTNAYPDHISTLRFYNYNNFIDVSCGHNYTLAIITNRADIYDPFDFTAGSLYAAGLNDTYQLGLGHTVNKDEFTPLDVGNNWVYINAGYMHNFAIKDDGTLWSWGKNTYGQLGLGNTTDATTPTQVGSDTNWKKVVACGFDDAGFSLGLKTNGELWVWGYNGYGQLGLGNTTDINTPTRLGSSYWVDIDGGYNHSIGVKNDGPTGGLVDGNAIYSWGYNSNGQLGVGSKTDNQQKLIPTKIDNGISTSSATHAILNVKWIGGSNKQHSDGINTDKHKLKVSIQPMHTPYPSYYEIFTIYDTDNKGTYKKWKYKGWEKNLKVICIGGGGGGGTAPKEELGFMTTAAGGGGGGAVAMAEFLATPFRVSGYTDNYPIFYGIPNEVDIHIGPGGYSSKSVPITPRMIQIQNQLKVLLAPIDAALVILRSELKALLIKRFEYVIWNSKKGQLELLPGSGYATIQEITDAINNKRNELDAKESERDSEIAPFRSEIAGFLSANSANGLNGINGSFSRFGDYLIAAGGDGGKAGRKISNQDFVNKILGTNPTLESISTANFQKNISESLISDGGKGGGKAILLKPTDDTRGVYKLYPFKANNTPNVGLSSTYLPGGNGGMGSLGNTTFIKQTNDDRIAYLQNTLIPNAETNLQNAIDSVNLIEEIKNAEIEAARQALKNLTDEKNSLEFANLVYNYVINNPTIYTNDAESVFYACTGGGGGFGYGGSIFGTAYSHQVGDNYINVAAIIPQTVKIASGLIPGTNSYISNIQGAGFKLGVGGDGGTTLKITTENVYGTGNSLSVPIKNGGFPGGGGGGGIPKNTDIFDVNSLIFNFDSNRPDVGVGVWYDNERGGGNGGDGLVVVIGM